jgi:LacI family transcriptional regulator
MEDVAAAASVSIATISHVINGTRNVSDPVRERVLRAIDELGYEVNPIARNLRKGSSQIVGLVVSNLANYFYTDLAAGVESILRPAGYDTHIINSNESLERETRNVRDLALQSADGIILAPTGNDCSYLQDATFQNQPFVFVDRKPRRSGHDSVMSTNFKGSYEAVNHLLSKGHARIGFIASRSNETMMERFSGYRQALSDSGVAPEEELVLMGQDEPKTLKNLLRAERYSQLENYLETARPTGIFLGNGLAAVGVFQYLRDNGIRVPEDIALLSFDDEFWYQMSTPQISAVAQDPYQIGVVAAERLLKRMRGGTGKYRTIRIKTRLILRESC